MTDSVNLRAVVLDILMEINEKGEFSHLLINNALTKYQYLDKNKRAFIGRLSLGTIENRIELDYIIDQFSKTPVRKMKPLIRNICEMSVYQIIYMDNIPDSAVCNEAVKLAEEIAAQAPIAVSLVKEAVNVGMQTDLNSALKFEGNCFAQCFATEDQKYGMAYFLDKNRDKPAKEFKNK